MPGPRKFGSVRPRGLAGPNTDQAIECAQTLYAELTRSRDRLAELPPLTPLDLEAVAQVLHELIWFLMTPPVRATTPLALSAKTKASLVKAARNRELDCYVTVIGLLVRKAAQQGSDTRMASMQVDTIRDALDALTFDYRSSKRSTIEVLRQLRTDVEARIAYVIAQRQSGYKFPALPELYARRKDKRERADKFFQRVYAIHVPRGLAQADIRRVDPAFYNVLHVWCSRHDRKLASLVPASRTRPR
jgi:hypothetical protein